tara:strand:- start:2453 stop:5065 length:2613 start_codon:yes stop_codon:yes gene_type:complete
MQYLTLIVALFLTVYSLPVTAKSDVMSKSATQVEQGVLRWVTGENSGEEVALFGVNYNTPFAYTYRAIAKLGIDHKDAIDMDINHIARLGLDAYRIHLWDRELSDVYGNLLKNEHLELFDYLLFKLKEKNIKVIITPIAWWGSGYPEPDPVESGFSEQFSKAQMSQRKDAIAAQHNYLSQLLEHENRYTGISYADESNIIAFELFNEPKHHQKPSKIIEYVEGLIDVIRDAGVTKPLFYNISEQGNYRAYAEALCSSKIDGIAYQWYPTGLVKNSKISANMLPMVAKYTNPFSSIDSCANKAKMIYEFDAADVESSVMYPAMARSFRSAGFQWATQFSYDPAVIAHTNSEYNTHYLNLLYTPRKALSFMIAAQTFRQLPLGFNSPSYPENNRFDDVLISHQQNLSLYNSEQIFYYSNSNQVAPKNRVLLEKIGGVGSSPLISYAGSGAYFLDKLSDGLWNLEVYPDVQELEDPYQNSSLKRQSRRLYLNSQRLKITLDDLGSKYWLHGINQGNEATQRARNGAVSLLPGKYLISQKQLEQKDISSLILSKQVSAQYYLPKIPTATIEVSHQRQRSFAKNDEIQFSVNIGAVNKVNEVELAIRYRGHAKFTHLKMMAEDGNNFVAKLQNTEPWSQTGPLEYAIVVYGDNEVLTFPGRSVGSPSDWDFVAKSPYWQTYLQPPGAPIKLFDALQDNNNLLYPKDGRVKQDYVSGAMGEGTVLRLGLDGLRNSGNNFLLRTELAIDNRLQNRKFDDYNTLAVKVRSIDKNEHINLGLLNKDGLAYSIGYTVKPEWQIVLIPLSALAPDDVMMIKAYPTFMPTLLDTQDSSNFSMDQKLSLIQGLQVSMDASVYSNSDLKTWHAIEIEYVSLIRR